MTRGILESEMLAGASIPLSFEMPHRHIMLGKHSSKNTMILLRGFYVF
jgi:hypothetical protein